MSNINRNGSGFEVCIAALLRTNFSEVQEQWASSWIGLFGQQIRCDFRCDDRLIYEVKFQDVRGSVEQKIVHSIEQIKTCYHLPTILVMGGMGYSDGCIQWALQQTGGALIRVETVEKFISKLVRKDG